MGLFRRAKGTCPACGKEKRADVGEGDRTAKTWPATCSACNAAFEIKVDSSWWIAFRDPAGTYRRRRIGPNYRAAKTALAKVRVEIAEGAYVDRKKTCQTTLGELIRMYIADIATRRKVKGLTVDTSTLKIIERFFGAGRKIDKITAADADRFRRARTKEGRAVATINRNLTVLSAALSWAVRQGLLSKRPTFEMINPHNERTRFLTREEAKRLIAVCDESIRDLVRAALATGMRRGELLAMSWDWIDLRIGLINIPGTSTKNKRPRHVPISPDMRAVLEEARAKAAPGAPVLHWHGKTIPAHIILKNFSEAREKIGIPDLRVHDLRHTAASWMVQAGVDLYSVATVLGHRDLKMTQRYSHLAPGHLADAIKHTTIDPTITEDGHGAKGDHPAITGQVIPLKRLADSRG